MPRLIDADVLKGCIISPRCNGKSLLMSLIDSIPTIDAVPVIRCKDCARNPNNGKARTICPCPMDRYMGPEGYCSKAEPKEADEE